MCDHSGRGLHGGSCWQAEAITQLLLLLLLF
jgi:hypothetical protein